MNIHQQNMDLNRNMWPSSDNLSSQHNTNMGGMPTATASMMTPPVHFFPNGLQLNQMWMDSLAKGMTQEQQTQQQLTQRTQQQQTQTQQHTQQHTQQPQYQQPQQQQQQQQQFVPAVSPILQPVSRVMTAAASAFPRPASVGFLPNATFSNNVAAAASMQQQQQGVQQVQRVQSTPSLMNHQVPSFPQAPTRMNIQLVATMNHHQQQQQQQQQQRKLQLLSQQQRQQQQPQPQPQKNKAKSAKTPTPRNNQINQAAAEKERKRKNREFAKRSREKRKNEHTHLEKELLVLQKENVRLRQIVQDKIPTNAQAILKNCCKDHPLHHAAVKQGVNDALAMSDFQLLENLIKEQQSFCMTDPMQADNPIVYASPSFCQLTGYSKDQVLGRNCRLLQGKDTDPKTVALVKESIKNGKDTSVNLLNYKANGTPFWNQFFIVALRNHSGKIVNFVGVQCEIEDPSEAMPDDSLYKVIEQKNKSIRIKGPVNIVGGLSSSGEPLPLISEIEVGDDNTNMAAVLQPTPIAAQDDDHQHLQPLDHANFNGMMDEEENRVDWSMLANVLEDDFRNGFDDMQSDHLSMNDDNNTASVQDAQSASPDSDDWDSDDAEHKNKKHVPCRHEAELEYRTLTPRALVTRTCRSELVASLLSCHGDVTNPRFLKSLEVMSSIYASSDPYKPIDNTKFFDNFLNSAWVSLSRPAYDGCLGKTDRGDFIYNLGKMSFNMFKPGHLNCSIQHTLNKIDYVCDMNEARNVVPWSLRRELAMTEEEDGEASRKQQKTLRSYDIEIAMTIQPSEDENGPKKPLRAIQILNGYMLRDPNENNRLSVWFTGGKLAPFMPDDKAEPTPDDEYGSMEDWNAVFDKEYTSSWSESFQNIGAKLFLGAQLPHGMHSDGSLNYSLTRPYGGHGKSFIDVLYLDEGLLITRGNNGTIHVMVRSNLLCPTQEGDNGQVDGAVKSATEVSGASDPTSTKRKASDLEDTIPEESNDAPVTLSWQEQLRKDLANRNPASIKDDLSSILQEYGIQIDSTTKRAKLN